MEDFTPFPGGFERAKYAKLSRETNTYPDFKFLKNFPLMILDAAAEFAAAKDAGPFLGGGFKYFFIFTPIVGEDSYFD